MMPAAETCYRAMTERDARYDGCFFAAAATTGIYCRPICRGRLPRRENCRYYPTAAAAEASGYRPCLRCRPELAPGNASGDLRRRIAASAAALMKDGLQEGAGVEILATRLGVTATQLCKVFRDEFGASPVEYRRTHRMLLAKRLLTDTTLSVAGIASVAGIHGPRRLEALYRERYRLRPSLLRQNPGRPGSGDAIWLEMSYRPPYDWPALAAFLAARSIDGVETANETAYRRIVRFAGAGGARAGWIEVRPDCRRAALRMRIAPSLQEAIPAVLAAAGRMFDLECHPALVAGALGPLSVRRPGLRVPGCFDGFEIAVRAVLGQQISVAAARTLAGRISAAFGMAVESPFAAVRVAFPAAGALAAAGPKKLARLGVLPTRARTIVDLAHATVRGELLLDPGADVESTLSRLRRIAGIGEWTAQYIAMRALAWSDAFPHTDLGVMKALGESSPKRVLEIGEAWRPWRAYAVMHLWMGGACDGTTR